MGKATDFLTALGAMVMGVGVILAFPFPTQAAERSLQIQRDKDYFGFDFKTLKKVDLEHCKQACLATDQCRAFTYNVKAQFCFLKSGFGESQHFKGAISGRIIKKRSEPELGTAPRLSYAHDYWREQAKRLSQALQKRRAEASPLGALYFTEQGQGAFNRNDMKGARENYGLALALEPQNSDLWSSYSAASLNLSRTTRSRKETRKLRDEARYSALLAYETSRHRSTRAKALARLGASLEIASWYREALNAYKASLSLVESRTHRDTYQRLLRDHGFRMVSHKVNSDSRTPRVCLQFSDPVKKDFPDFASYIRVNQQPPKALDVSKSQICVDGLAHGKSYQIDIRQGLPGENDETLQKNANLDIYVRDRAASLRFTGSNYVLPASNRRGIPLVSVNSRQAKLSLYRVGERSLAGLMRGSRFLSQLGDWEIESVVSDLGEPVWKGKLDIRTERNREVTTAIPIDEALPSRKPGIYLMTATPATIGAKDYPSYASQWFVVSDIGLTSFSSTAGAAAPSSEATAGGLQIFARSLKDAKALAGLEVSLIARNNELLGQATSDETGKVSFDAGLLRGKEGLAPAVLTAQSKAGDFVFLDLTRPGFDLSDRGVSGRPSPTGVDLYAWTERGIYRPGEVVHVAALARDRSAKAVSDLPLTFVFERPDGVEMQRLVGDGKALGGYAVELPLPANSARGTWRVKIFADPKQPALSEQMFLVDDFLPDRTDFTMKLAQDRLKVGEVGTAAITGRYLYGAPAAGLSLAGEVRVRESRKRSGFDGYLFGLAEEKPSGLQQFPLQNAPALDKQGMGDVSFVLDTLKASTRPQRAELVVRMREGSGRPIERRSRFDIAPTGAMIGIRPQFEDLQVGENSEAAFSVIGVGTDNQRLAMQHARWELIKIERHYQWYKDGSRWRYEAVDLENRVADGIVSLSTDSPASFSVPVEWGRYRLRLTGEGDVQSSVDFNAGWQAAAGSLDSPDGLELALDKASYKAGETAKLKISPRFAGEMLLAIGTDTIVETLSLSVPAEGTELGIPVKESWGGGVYLLANLYSPADSQAGRNPARAIGVQWLGINPAGRKLTVAMDVAEKALPHEQLLVPVKVEGVKAGEKAYVTLALVDQGILNLTRYKSPDPVGRYFGQRKLGLDIRDLYGRLIDGAQGAFGRLRSGGDGPSNSMKAEGNKPTQELVAFFSGLVQLDENGEADVPFDIPQFNGSARLMATTWTKDAMGQAEQDLVIRDPIVINTSLPRVLAPGDESRVLIELANKDAPEDAYKLEVVSDGPIQLDNNTLAPVVNLKKDETLSLSVPLKAQKPGHGSVTVKLMQEAASEGENEGDASGDKIDLSFRALVPVRSGIQKITRTERVPLAAKDGKVEISADLLAGYQAEDAELSVSIARAGLYDVPSLMMQLNRYPYGCAEQVTSKALPLLYATMLANDLPSGMAGMSGKERKKRLGKAIARLLSYQSAEGGFSLWGNGVDDAWLTAYVVDFLSRAREEGLDVPSQALKQGLQAVRNHLAYRSDLKRDANSMAYGLYVLARAKMASAGDLRYYVDTQLTKFGSPLARAQLGAALALYGDRQRADMAFSSGLELVRQQIKSKEDRFGASFGSSQRNLAAMVALAGEIQPALASQKALRALAKANYDPEKATSTQEQAWMLMAARTDKTASDTLALTVDGANHEGAFVQTFTGSTLSEGAVSIANKGTEAVEAVITSRARPTNPLPAGGNGFEISRAYYSLDGKPATIAEVTQNDRFVVVLTARMTKDIPAQIIVSDLLPAGLEVENPKLISSADGGNFAWLPKRRLSHVELRSDRVLAAFQHKRGDALEATIAYSVRAVTPGTYAHPAAVIEDMYRPARSARTHTGWMVVRAP